MITLWQPLLDELDAWQAQGKTATMWWRDDDLIEPSVQLERMLALQAKYHLPLAFAVIPNTAQPTLTNELGGNDELAVLQHGYGHFNHAPDGQKKQELGILRPLEMTLGELALGKQRLETLFTGQFKPVMVPPWNRIHDSLSDSLMPLGFIGLSTFGARRQGYTLSGLRLSNSHIDAMQWRPQRQFVGVPSLVAQFCQHLRARRLNEVDGEEATGLMTHHLVHDAALWQALDTLFELLAGHAAVRWQHVDDIFVATRQAINVKVE